MKAFPNMTGQQGMDLRDYFASDAMKAFLTHDRILAELHKDDFVKTLMGSAYRMADAMMQAREVK